MILITKEDLIGNLNYILSEVEKGKEYVIQDVDKRYLLSKLNRKCIVEEVQSK